MRRLKLLEISGTILFLIAVIIAKEIFEGEAMGEGLSSETRLRDTFKRSRLVCFGRYAIEIPWSGELIIGRASMPSDITIVQSGMDGFKELISKEVARIEKRSETAELIYNGVGPISNSWQIRYFADKHKKKRNAVYFSTLIAKGDVTFMTGDGVSSGESESLVADRQAKLAKSLRILGPSEITSEPGFCIENGFAADAAYARQEVIDAGFHFPEHPDVTFSISSNKDAYADLDPSEFAQSKRDTLPLLARIRQAKELQGNDYPFRVVLREGKRTVQHWQGEESLFRREDGTHDFEWAFVGTPKDVANPSEYRIRMFTKVAHNTVGAAEKSSLTDDEAVALWDKLLSGLKFRVKVPGAPEGSYYFLPGADTQSGEKP
jgi:hypothetical protein